MVILTDCLICMSIMSKCRSARLWMKSCMRWRNPRRSRSRRDLSPSRQLPTPSKGITLHRRHTMMSKSSHNMPSVICPRRPRPSWRASLANLHQPIALPACPAGTRARQRHRNAPIGVSRSQIFRRRACSHFHQTLRRMSIWTHRARALPLCPSMRTLTQDHLLTTDQLHLGHPRVPTTAQDD